MSNLIAAINIRQVIKNFLQVSAKRPVKIFSLVNLELNLYSMPMFGNCCIIRSKLKGLKLGDQLNGDWEDYGVRTCIFLKCWWQRREERDDVIREGDRKRTSEVQDCFLKFSPFP